MLNTGRNRNLEASQRLSIGLRHRADETYSATSEPHSYVGICTYWQVPANEMLYSLGGVQTPGTAPQPFGFLKPAGKFSSSHSVGFFSAQNPNPVNTQSVFFSMTR